MSYTCPHVLEMCITRPPGEPCNMRSQMFVPWGGLVGGGVVEQGRHLSRPLPLSCHKHAHGQSEAEAVARLRSACADANEAHFVRVAEGKRRLRMDRLRKLRGGAPLTAEQTATTLAQMGCFVVFASREACDLASPTEGTVRVLLGAEKEVSVPKVRRRRGLLRFIFILLSRVRSAVLYLYIFYNLAARARALITPHVSGPRRGRGPNQHHRTEHRGAARGRRRLLRAGPGAGRHGAAGRLEGRPRIGRRAGDARAFATVWTPA